MSGFEVFEPTKRGGAPIGSIEDPAVTITKEGVYLGVVVWREILDEPAAIEYQVDAANARVGFKPVDSNDAPGAYAISEYQARAAPVWEAIGAEVDESERVPLDVDSEAFPVVDLSRFVPEDGSGTDGGDGGADRDASDASDDDQHQPDLPFGCPVVDCPKRFDDREDRRTHRDNAHDEVAVLRGYRERCREDLPREISVAAVQRAVVANTRVGEIADGLCVEKADARKWINMLQLTDAKNEHGEAQAVRLIEDLHDELGIDEPVPAMPGEGDDSDGELA